MSENLTTNVEMDSTANGTVSFATDVVATIAGLAATEVEGVAAMINNGNLGLVDMLRKNQGNRTMTRGVKVEINGNQVRVQLNVTVDYGSPVPTVAREIQDNVKKAIETMTGLDVPEINIYVQGISFEKENRAAAELEQKQRAALNAAKVERLNHGEETKPEPKAEEKAEQPAAEEPAEGEKRRSWFSLRRPRKSLRNSLKQSPRMHPRPKRSPTSSQRWKNLPQSLRPRTQPMTRMMTCATATAIPASWNATRRATRALRKNRLRKTKISLPINKLPAANVAFCSKKRLNRY